MASTLPESIYTLRVFLHRFRRQLLRGFLIPFALFVVLSFVPTPRYKATSVMIVRLGPEYIYQPEVAHSAAAPNQLIPFDRDQIFKSEVAILNSRDLHEAVIRAMGIETLFPKLVHPAGIFYVIASVHNAVRDTLTAIAQFVGIDIDVPTDEEKQRKLMARAVALFDKRFDIELEKESAVISLSFEHKDDAIAAKTLETLLKLYFDKRQEFYRETRVDLATAQLQSRRREAQIAERALAKFKRLHHIYAFDDQRDELLHQRDAAQAMAVNIIDPGLQQKINDYDRQLDAMNALESDWKVLNVEATNAETAVTNAALSLDEAKAYDERQHEHAQSVRIVQSPATPAEPKKWQWLILLLGLFVSAGCSLMVGLYCEYIYNTAPMASLLQQRKKRTPEDAV